jgi:hypothetical protein
MTPLHKCLVETSLIKCLPPKLACSFSVKKHFFTPISQSNVVKPVPKTMKHISHPETKKIAFCIQKPSIEIMRMLQLLIDAKKKKS